MNKAEHALPDNSRRQFLKATALGVAGAALGARPGVGAPKTMSIMHENSFIKTYDEYFKKTLVPAYEKATGIKINYELVSVGSLQTRITTAAETGIRSRHDAELLQLAVPVRREARRCQRHRRGDRQEERRLARRRRRKP